MKNTKHPILVGLLLFVLGLGGILALRALNFDMTHPSFLQTFAMLLCSSLVSAGGVMIFLRFVTPPKI